MLLFIGMRLEESCPGMCRLYYIYFLAEENAQDFVFATVARYLALHPIRKLRVYKPLS